MDVMKDSMVPMHAVVRQNILWWAQKDVGSFLLAYSGAIDRRYTLLTFHLTID